jgi:hypothetical protein
MLTVVDEFPIKSETFRLKAEECRTMAEAFKHDETRNLLLRGAADYELMASRAEAREETLVEQSLPDPAGGA